MSIYSQHLSRLLSTCSDRERRYVPTLPSISHAEHAWVSSHAPTATRRTCLEETRIEETSFQDASSQKVSPRNSPKETSQESKRYDDSFPMGVTNTSATAATSRASSTAVLQPRRSTRGKAKLTNRTTSNQNAVGGDGSDDDPGPLTSGKVRSLIHFFSLTRFYSGSLSHLLTLFSGATDLDY